MSWSRSGKMQRPNWHHSLKAEGMDCGDILYSWDNDRIHVGADLATVGIADDMRLELPECSSDMHKVIEHVHGNIQREFDEWLWGLYHWQANSGRVQGQGA